MKFNKNTAYTFRNQEELDWLTEKLEEEGFQITRKNWTYNKYIDMILNEAPCCISVLYKCKDSVEYSRQQWYREEGYKIVEVADLMKEEDMVQLEVKQVWEFDNQKELDAILALAKKQGVSIYKDYEIDYFGDYWVYLTIVEKIHELELCACTDYYEPTHHGKDLLSEQWVEVEREDNIGSRGDTLIVKQNSKTEKLRLTTGCFSGTLDEFERQVKLKPEGNKHRIVYEWLIEKYKRKYPKYMGNNVGWKIKLNEKSWVGEAGNNFTSYESKAKLYNVIANAELIAEEYAGEIKEVEI